MNTLEQVFAEGHAIARARNPVQRAVKSEDRLCQVAPRAVAGLAINRRIEPSVLEGEIPPDRADEQVWEPDYDHCWCEKCGETRKLQDTHCD